jgi:hypothetical protein
MIANDHHDVANGRQRPTCAHTRDYQTARMKHRKPLWLTVMPLTKRASSGTNTVERKTLMSTSNGGTNASGTILPFATPANCT